MESKDIGIIKSEFVAKTQFLCFWLFWFHTLKLKLGKSKIRIYFRGQIETPAKSLGSLVINEDTEVQVAINSTGLYVLDPVSRGPDSIIIGQGSESPFISLHAFLSLSLGLNSVLLELNIALYLSRGCSTARTKYLYISR